MFIDLDEANKQFEATKKELDIIRINHEKIMIDYGGWLEEYKKRIKEYEKNHINIMKDMNDYLKGDNKNVK